ncbi:MAG: tRNA 2-thiouridine(34) synthase MnmA [Steroidobacteraceae bacterium]
MDAKRTRVIVGLSGGVDSAVAALLLKEQGFDVQGLHMSNWEDDDGYCTASRDYQDARAVARALGIPLHRVSFAAEYRARVFDRFLAQLRAGRTPNPDVLCNREVKFGVALGYARRLGGQFLATGHYARLVREPGQVQLHAARDRAKDQTYFLHAIEREDLGQALMPLADLLKGEVRERARSAGLPVHDKPDSTGICFIGERPFREFLARYLPSEPGPIETPSGERLGTHLGIAFYTLGQRSGLTLGGRRGAAAQPWYVVAKDSARNALIVVQGRDHPALRQRALETERVHWLADPIESPQRCAVKVRHRQEAQPALLEPLASGCVRIRFDEPQRSVTPGQYAVIYQDTRCLGGGVIERGSADIISSSAEDEPLRRIS